MKKVFLTYSKTKNSRLKYRAIECGWFDEVKISYDEGKSLKDLIIDGLSSLDNGDILVFADEFSEINLNGWMIFNKRIESLNDHSILVKTYHSNEYVLYIRKSTAIEDLFKQWNGDISEFKDKENIKFLKPSLKSLQAPSYNLQIEFRCCDDDIISSCKKNFYERYSMFVAGHVLPFYEDNYDCYTHFINVGENELHRCSANTLDNIKEHQDLAELTALYWIWKNINVDDLEYIGFSTYRKPFLKTNEEMIGSLRRDGYECIANRYHSNFSRIHKMELGEENVKEFEDILKDIMSKEEYSEFIDDYENGKFIYICNSFVMPINSFRRFCEDVFKVMIPVAEKMKGKNGIKDHRPCAGCFAEAVTSFYLKKMFRRIYTSPFLIYPLYQRYVDDDLASLEPIVFGTTIENGKEIFLPLGECPRQNVDEKASHKFYIKNDRTYRINEIFNTQAYLIQKKDD